MTFDLNVTEQIEEPSNHEQLEKQDYSQLPDLSDSILSTDGKVKFCALFVKYCDVFALSDSDSESEVLLSLPLTVAS